MRKEYDFNKLERAEPRYLKQLKKPITIRLDPHVIGYFKSLAAELGMPYQAVINLVLRDYATHGLSPSANWHAKEASQK